MEFGIVGLGRMGGNMARRFARQGIKIAVMNRSFDVTEALVKETGHLACVDYTSLVTALEAPRIVWLMLPAGEVTEAALSVLLPLLSSGDLIVDGSNGHYKDDRPRAVHCAQFGIEYVDAGVSGGVWGLENGYCIMFGGSDAVAGRLQPYMQALSPTPTTGWLHTGPVGSGHYVKMIHNGIEYGMMQAFAEGFALMKDKSDFALDLAAISELWRHGSVVRSWLLDLSAEFLAEDQIFDGIEPFVADSGEGRWTALAAIEQGIPAPVMTLALAMRFATQGKNDYAARLLAKMRQGFGGHAVKEN
ncbi:phosphogluconate dehydrogenase (NAD(+)-dependent, decarboxylating) [Nitrosomonas sp. Is37]|uniref:phosphogluconate dehydrogenase (NAD(+)-dependent, decarboxylating) n=1 Tax=Nitrosomonas sp. Is37 TaxID=3080535 RepID=UPI00294AFB94|nr:decarboxylating 6-phosphogluconate dehydrogenase [Nitrosomonas sp. Is37]MDV6344616.1 decarboxylating 6-phosphogluconate dehydrogenase [Nitrosomonas sp. Is37]